MATVLTRVRALACVLAVALLALATVASASCRRSEPRPPATSPAAGTLTVFAAASLREAFTDLAAELARTRPDAPAIMFNFAGSQELRTQIEHGAPADVFASADTRHMAALRKAGLVGAPTVFTRNEPVIAVARDKAAAVTSLADLPKVQRLVIGAPDVPIGRYTLEILDRAAATLGADFRARVEARVVSRELNVRQVLAKLNLGEADAAIVYRTDALTASDKIAIVPIPPAVNVIAEYPIAALARSPRAALARAFIDLTLSARGREVLRARGFVPPETAAAPAPATGGTNTL